MFDSLVKYFSFQFFNVGLPYIVAYGELSITIIFKHADVPYFYILLILEKTNKMQKVENEFIE